VDWAQAPIGVPGQASLSGFFDEIQEWVEKVATKRRAPDPTETIDVTVEPDKVRSK